MIPNIPSLIGPSIIALAVLIILFGNTLKINKNRCVQLFFFIFLICGLSQTFSPFLLQFSILLTIGSLWMYTAFAFVLLHSSLVLGNRKTTALFSISLLFGLFSELLGVKYGWIFGNYYYVGKSFFFGIVPLLTPFSWAIIIYISYTISNIFLKGFKGKKPTLPTHNLFAYSIMIILLSAIAGLIAVNIDMILDPVAVSPQIAGWVWIGGGSYFGIPISNFLGWFFVTFFAILLFRIYESFSSNTTHKMKFNTLDLYLPIIYLIYLLMNSTQSIKIGHSEYALIGATTMLPFILIILLIYLNSKEVHNNELQ